VLKRLNALMLRFVGTGDVQRADDRHAQSLDKEA
jgi:hypothetical protein